MRNAVTMVLIIRTEIPVMIITIVIAIVAIIRRSLIPVFIVVMSTAVMVVAIILKIPKYIQESASAAPMSKERWLPPF